LSRRYRHHDNHGNYRNPAEDIVERVLGKLRTEDRISGFIRNRPNDRLDIEGIDFLIFLKNGLALPLQVKTLSREGNDRKADWHRQKHPLVKFLIFVPIYSKTADEEIEQRLKAILKIQPPQ
jgi:hypothetical protein